MDYRIKLPTKEYLLAVLTLYDNLMLFSLEADHLKNVVSSKKREKNSIIIFAY